MTALVWAVCLVGALVFLVTAYLVLASRALQNEHVIGSAIVAMRAALATGPPPQRALLGAVAEAMAAQEHTAARIEAAIRELALRGDQGPRPGGLLDDLLSLPEPQLLVADFLREHAGSPGSDAALASVAADILRVATVAAFSDLADQGLVELDRLLVLAEDGQIAKVALASLDSSLDPNPPTQRVPGMADLDPAGMTAIVRALDRTTRRQLRLATVLHGQAEAMLRRPRGHSRGLTALWMRLRALSKFPLPRAPRFQLDDLDALAIAFDAVGETVDMAEQLLVTGQPVRAVRLLSGLRVPVPEGLPGRMYLQESLAQARPLARFCAWHRLAVCRWAASSLRAIASPDKDMGEPGRPGSPTGSADVSDTER